MSFAPRACILLNRQNNRIIREYRAQAPEEKPEPEPFAFWGENLSALGFPCIRARKRGLLTQAPFALCDVREEKWRFYAAARIMREAHSMRDFERENRNSHCAVLPID